MLHHLNLDIPQHQIVALVGASGSGKSTVVSLLMGLFTPTAGSINIQVAKHEKEENKEKEEKEETSSAKEDITAMVPLENLPRPWWHHSVAYVPQEPVLYDGLSILEYIQGEQESKINSEHFAEINKKCPQFFFRKQFLIFRILVAALFNMHNYSFYNQN